MMSRTHSLTSISTSASTPYAPSARPAYPELPRQDRSTDNLVPEAGTFSRKSRKNEPSGKSAYSFPNGEKFTPRLGPKRRNRPARIPTAVPAESVPSNYPPRLPRSASMVSVSSATSMPGYDNATQSQAPFPPTNAANAGKHPASFLSRSHSFNNIRQRSKQDLVHSLRHTKVDTPTNISVQVPKPAPSAAPPPQHVPHLRSMSLTNNRYSENAANIVRSESMLSTSIQDVDPAASDRTARSESSPSSLTNFNLNRSNSNTPQTSVSGSDIAAEIAIKSWSSSESVSSFRTARDPSPLSSIKESVGTDTPHADPVSLTSPGIRAESGAFMSGSQNDDSPSSSPTSLESAPAFDYENSNGNETAEVDMIKDDDLSDKSPQKPKQSHEATKFRPDAEVPNTMSTISETSSSMVVADSEDISEVSNLDHPSNLVAAQDANREAPPVEPELDLTDKERTNEPTTRRSVSKAASLESQKTLKQTQDVTDRAESLFDLHALEERKSTSSAESLEHEKSGDKDDMRDVHSANGKVTMEGASSGPELESDDRSSVLLQPKGDLHAEAHESSLIAKESFETGSNCMDCRAGNEEDPQNVPREHAHEESRASPGVTILKRRNLDLAPILTPPALATDRESLPDTPSPDVEEPARATKSDSDLPELIEQLISTTEAPPRGDIPIELQENAQSPREEGANTLQTSVDDEKTIIEADERKSFVMSELYSPIHIDKFLTDDQEAVPPRGDVAVKNGAIKFHKRNSSSVTSINSFQKRSTSLSPGQSSSPYECAKANKSTETLRSPEKQKQTPLARNSMLAVVDVDYDKLLPPTPKRDFFSKGPHVHSPPKVKPSSHRKESPKEKVKLPDRSPSKSSSSSSNSKGIKRFFKFMKFGSKGTEESPPKLRWKSSMSSIRTSVSSRDRKVGEAPEPRPVQPSSRRHSKEQPRALEARGPKPASDRKKAFLSNLKLTTGFKVYDLPSPVYSVRERTPTGERQSLSSGTENPKFDLPEYDVESDSFGDVLLKFQEVEKEIENEVRVMRKTKSIHDFFLKDDELSKSQIFDLQTKDNQVSSDSLAGQPDSQNGSVTKLDALGSDSANSSQETLCKKLGHSITDFPESSEKRVVTVDIASASAALADSHGARQSYLRFVRQFADFQEMTVELSGFDPTERTDVPVNSEQKVSSLRKTGSRPARNVKFSNSIAISETYAPQLYRRNNKSVTQYYLTEYSEINRIKNELNAYKCYEMLVHEKSQANTHFFY
ncbi:hypothetical protein OXX80_010173 [Metschnikowia pulcherrima]